MMFTDLVGEGERRWFVLERPRRDTNGGSETGGNRSESSKLSETSKLPANAEGTFD